MYSSGRHRSQFEKSPHGGSQYEKSPHGGSQYEKSTHGGSQYEKSPHGGGVLRGTHNSYNFNMPHATPGQHQPQPLRSNQVNMVPLVSSPNKKSSSSSSLDTIGSESPLGSKSFTSLLFTFDLIMKKFGRRKRDGQLRRGMQIPVFITSVFDEKHFWAQVVDNVS